MRDYVAIHRALMEVHDPKCPDPTGLVSLLTYWWSGGIFYLSPKGGLPVPDAQALEEQERFHWMYHEQTSPTVAVPVMEDLEISTETIRKVWEDRRFRGFMVTEHFNERYILPALYRYFDAWLASPVPDVTEMVRYEHLFWGHQKTFHQWYLDRNRSQVEGLKRRRLPVANVYLPFL